MKKVHAPCKNDENYSMTLHVREDTEFEVSDARSGRVFVGIGSLKIFLSREDLIQLGEAIAEYMGGTFAPAGSVLAVAKVWAGQE